jgi:hypothetical protein
VNESRAEYLEGVDRWFAAARRADHGGSPDVPEDVKAEMLENRARNEQGLCFRSDCGRPLFDDHACPEHSERATETQRM